MTLIYKKLSGASAIAILAFSALPAYAQDNRLDEIIVTATKRATGLQDTPIAITAVSATKLERQNVDNISEIASFTPNLVFDTTSPVSGVSNGAVVFIRGVGQTDFQLTTDPGVGTYIDGVYTSRSVGGVMDVLDLERVEVLRGPQGTLFGRNAIGGAINMVSKRPEDEFSGKASVTFGSRDRLDLSALLNIPITDTLRTRVSLSSRNQDGYVISRVDGRDLGDTNRDSLRAVAEWTPTDNFTATISLDGSQTDEQNAASRLVGITLTPPGSDQVTEFSYNASNGSVTEVTRSQIPGPPSLAFLHNVVDTNFIVIPGFEGRLFDGSIIPTELDETFASGPNGTEVETYGISGVLEYKTDFATIKSTTAFRDSSGQFARDADGSPFRITESQNFDYDHEQFSQELQFTGDSFDGALQWAAGLYYFDEKGNDVAAIALPAAFGVVRNFTFVENKSIAGYAQATYGITDAFNVTGGIRYTEDDKTYTVPEGGGAVENGVIGIFGAPGTLTSFFPAGENSEKFDDVSYKLGADYKLQDGTLLYGSFSTGFKSGGFNTRYLVPVEEVVSFDPETVESFEVGVKWQGFDNRVRLNAAAFSSDYEDIQLIVYESGAPLTRNAGTADIKGIELEATAVLSDRFDLSAGFGYTDAEYTSVRDLDPALDAFQQVTLDTRLPNTPEFTFTWAADYNHPLGNGEALVHLDYAHSSSIENDAINSPFLSEGPTDVMNGSVGYSHNDGQWAINVFVDNLTDERFITSGDSNFGIGFHEANFNRPREWGVKLKTEF